MVTSKVSKIKQFGPLYIIISSLLLNLDGIIRRGLYTLPPAVVVFYEHILGFIVLLFFLPLWIKDVIKLRRKEWIAIILISIFSGALGTILYTAALGQVHFIQYSVVVLLQQLQPIWAISAAAIILKEKITKRFILWAAFALVAAYFISFKNGFVTIEQSPATVIAALLALGAGFVWGVSTALSRQVLLRVSTLTATALRFILAPFFIIFFIVFSGQTHALFTLSHAQWVALWLIVFSSGLVSLFFYYYGLKRTPARITTLYELTWPATSIFIDYYYFHQGLSITQIFGVVLLFIALYRITIENRKEIK